ISTQIYAAVLYTDAAGGRDLPHRSRVRWRCRRQDPGLGTAHRQYVHLIKIDHANLRFPSVALVAVVHCRRSRQEEGAMDDLKFGKRNKRGDGAPDTPIETAPLFNFPPRLKAILHWLPHYLFPWNMIFAASAVAYWAWVIPPLEVMQSISFGWVA